MNDDNKSKAKYLMLDSHPSMQEEISMLELIRTLLQSWKFIFYITVFSTCMSFIYSLLSPEVFKAEILLAPAQKEKAGMPSSFSQFGGLAAMAGVSIPSDSNTEQVVATLQSRKFIRYFIEKKKLLPVLFEDLWDAQRQVWLVQSSDDEPTILNAVMAFQEGVISVDHDKKSGLVTVSLSWNDPELAAEWANALVEQLNEQLRAKAIRDSKKRIGYLEEELAKTTLNDMREVLYNVLETEKRKAMLANVNEDFALEVIDPAVVPEKREKPKRKMIVALGCVFGGFLGVFLVFFIQFIKNLKSVDSKSHSFDA